MAEDNMPRRVTTSSNEQRALRLEIEAIGLADIGLTNNGTIPVPELLGNWHNLTDVEIDEILDTKEYERVKYPRPIGGKAFFFYWSSDDVLCFKQEYDSRRREVFQWAKDDWDSLAERAEKLYSMFKDSRDVELELFDVLCEAAERPDMDSFHTYFRNEYGLNDTPRDKLKSNLMKSSYDFLICSDSTKGDTAVLLVDYDGMTSCQIVNGVAVSKIGLEHDNFRLNKHKKKKRIRKFDCKIRIANKLNIPYIILNHLSLQQIYGTISKPTLARFGVIRGLLQAFDMGLFDLQMSNKFMSFDKHVHFPHYRNLIPLYDRFEIAMGAMESLHALGNDVDVIISISPDYTINFEKHEPDDKRWSDGMINEDFLIRKINRYRNAITSHQLARETGYTTEEWPHVVITGPNNQVVMASDGIQTSRGDDYLAEPYLGILGSMYVEHIGLPIGGEKYWEQDFLSEIHSKEENED